jgi:hypothetical protein
MAANLEYDESLRTFLADQKIEDAYQILKPVFDKIHEEFITMSLNNNDIAKAIDFAPYFIAKKEGEAKEKELKEKKQLLDKKEKDETITEGEKEQLEKINKEIKSINVRNIESDLRKYFEKCFEAGGKWLKNGLNGIAVENEVAEEENEEDVDESNEEVADKKDSKKGFRKLLTAKIILGYIKNNLNILETDKEKQNKIKAALKFFIKDKDDKNSKNFSTYFSGFDENRRNYYVTKKEADTAIATRIVNYNLLKFYNNKKEFEYKKKEYLGVYEYLQNKKIILQAKNGVHLSELTAAIFEIKKDNKNNVPLSQGEIDSYNKVIGNANYLINLYNQQRKREAKAVNDKIKEKNKGKKDNNKKEEIKYNNLKSFVFLYKQIGCGEKKEFIPTIKGKTEAEKNKYLHDEIFVKASKAGEKYFDETLSQNGAISTIFDFIDYLKKEKAEDNYNGVYWSNKALNIVSSSYFGNWTALGEKLVKAKVLNKGDKKKDASFSIPKVVGLAGLFEVLDKEMEEYGKDENDNPKWKQKDSLFKNKFFENFSDNSINEKQKENKRKFEIISKSEKPSQALLTMILSDAEQAARNFVAKSEKILEITDYQTEKNTTNQEIKKWLDNALRINQILKLFKIKENNIKQKSEPLDPKISNFFETFVFTKDNPAKDYDTVRNYLTQKSQNKLGKLKLNFKNSSLAAGWDENKVSENYCTILKDSEECIYLAVLADKSKNFFQKKINEFKDNNKTKKNNPLYIISEESEAWHKMEYKQIAIPMGVGGFVRKCFNVAQQYSWICPKDCLNKEGKIVIQNDEAAGNLTNVIDCYKDFFNKYEKDGFKYKDYNFVFKKSDEYKTLEDFFGDVEKQSYKLIFPNYFRINKSVLDKAVENGEIYLFEINSKDNDYYYNKITNERIKKTVKKKKKDSQTIYWNEVFGDVENKPQLDGGAEIFYRMALEEKDLKMREWKNKEVIENFRFSKEKFIFHCPITLNPCLKNKRITDLVNENIAGRKNQLFLGIDRGEKHLAYYSLVNQKGEIVAQDTLNLPFLDKDGRPRSIKAEKYFEEDKKDNKEWKPRIVNCWNYNDLLDARASNRDLARKNWTTIGNIKDLKEGYISQVVRKIVDLAIYNEGDRKKGFRETPAFIVLEDLNIGFKRGRQKIEKQVYQKLELALAKKLNFLVDKGAKSGETASVDNALQLTPPVRDFGDIKSKQFGIMLYTNPGFTSTTDPITGWRKSISIKKGSEEYIKKQIMDFSTFTDFGFNGKDYFFKYKDANTGKEWILYSGKNGGELDRYRDKFSEKEGKKHWNPEKIEIVKNLEKIFDGFDKNKSFREQIKSGKQINKIDDHTAWESLRFIIDVIQDIRNTGKDEKDNDFILSPVREANGDFFDSRKIKNDEKFPQNGDANGAHNIARKGIIMSEHIKRGLDLYIRNEEWDAWLAGEKTWENYVAKNLKIRQKTV